MWRRDNADIISDIDRLHARINSAEVQRLRRYGIQCLLLRIEIRLRRLEKLTRVRDLVPGLRPPDIPVFCDCFCVCLDIRFSIVYAFNRCASIHPLRLAAIWEQHGDDIAANNAVLQAQKVLAIFYRLLRRTGVIGQVIYVCRTIVGMARAEIAAQLIDQPINQQIPGAPRCVGRVCIPLTRWNGYLSNRKQLFPVGIINAGCIGVMICDESAEQVPRRCRAAAVHKWRVNGIAQERKFSFAVNRDNTVYVLRCLDHAPPEDEVVPIVDGYNSH